MPDTSYQYSLDVRYYWWIVYICTEIPSEALCPAETYSEQKCKADIET